MHAFDPAHVTSTDTAIVPQFLALSPSDLSGGDGRYTWRGPRTGRLLRHTSALFLGVAATLEALPGTADLVALDDVLADGGPDWAEDLAARLDGDLAPDLLVRGVVGGREFVQAITVAADTTEARVLRAGSMRRRYHERGCAWSLFSAGDIRILPVASYLWVGEAVRRDPPKPAVQAVARVLDQVGSSSALVDVLFNAAVIAGVPVRTAIDALGVLVWEGGVEFDLHAGVIATDRPLQRESQVYPAAIIDTWREVIASRTLSGVAA